MLTFAAMTGQAFAYSNVSPRPARPETTSNNRSQRFFNTLDQQISPWATASDYRYRGGPKSND
jgi:hypothetical protein